MMKSSYLAMFAVALMIGTSFQPAMAEMFRKAPSEDDGAPTYREISAPMRELKELVAELLPHTTNLTDTDLDGLPDSIERVIGTNPDGNDSDSDRLTDWEEINLTLDPMNADTNGDRLADYLEVHNVSADVDGDGIPNTWDRDNDNDGVADGLDPSPMAKTQVASSFNVSVKTRGNPTYMAFQVRPSNPAHLNLSAMAWDWPDDSDGQMMDLDKSTEDIYITPLLELQTDVVLNQTQLLDYGIVTDNTTAFLPLFPVDDFGSTVAFNGKMLIPASGTPLTVTTTMSFTWRVNAYSDKACQAFKAVNGKYLSVNETGVVQADAALIGPSTQFEVIEQSDAVALKAANGKFLSVAPNGGANATCSTMDNTCLFTLGEWSGDKVFLKSSLNGRYLTLRADGLLAADASTISTSQRFAQVGAGSRPEMATLALYPDEFIITGMTLEENHGSMLGLYYTSNVSHLLAANMLLSVDYIHNVSNGISAIPPLFSNHGVNIQSESAAFAHQDLAVRESNGQLMKNALDSLPEGRNLPVSMVIEDNFTVLEMAQLSPGSYMAGRTLTADLTKAPVTTSRTLKSAWYNTSTNRPLELDAIVAEILTWGLDNGSFMTLMPMVVAWYDGEYETISVDGVSIQQQVPDDVSNVRETTSLITALSVKALGVVLQAVRAFAVLYCAYNYYVGISRMTSSVSFFSVAQNQYGMAKAANTGAMGNVNRGIKALQVIGLVIAVGIAIYTIIAVGCYYGWAPAGTMLGVVYALTSLSFTLLLFALGMLGPVGAVLAVLYALADLITWLVTGTSITDRIVGWVVKSIMSLVTKIETRSKVDMDIASTSVDINDRDMNGLDVGDTIEFTQSTNGIVKKTSKGSDKDLEQSYFKPDLYQKLPSKNKVYSKESASPVTDKTSGSTRTRQYYDTLSYTPSSATINFPFMVYMDYDYKIYYNDCAWVFGFWIKERKSRSGDDTTKQCTLYFDILPGTIDGFMAWNAIKSLDSDGDGIRNANETNTSPWLGDTDADGLSDKYELLIGTNPTLSDTDGDGLGDRLEVELGLNASLNDTDGDGLTDKQERDGWVISYEYESIQIHALVKSNPVLVDGDADGLNDSTEHAILFNPRSPDTNGDGIRDGSTAQCINIMEFNKRFGQDTKEGFDIAVDDDGYVYATSTYGYIRKFDPNGSFVTNLGAGVLNYPVGVHIDRDGYLWVADYSGSCFYKMNRTGEVQLNISTKVGNATLMVPADIAVDDDGFIYVVDQNEFGVLKYDPTGAFLLSWGGSGTANGKFTQPYAIDIDSKGRIYVSDPYNNRVQVFNSWGTYLKKWTVGTFSMWFDIDSNDDMLISETGPRKIEKFDYSGKLLATISQDQLGGALFTNQRGITSIDDRIYVLDTNGANSGVIVQLYHNVTIIPGSMTANFTDADGDGLTDVDENAGWNVTVSNSTGTFTYKVAPDPLVADTDADGLNDSEERKYSADPRVADTDGDGLSDGTEAKGLGGRAPGSNLTRSDSDGDGLGDGVEVTYGSDPTTNSSDDDGLPDYEEFLLGADPTSNDTDGDGLGDLGEVQFGSSVISADSDGDGSFDGLEFDLGTDPNSNDTDGDGLIDTDEDAYGTNPISNDTDGDGLPDGFEIENFLNATSNDTDGDGLNDKDELTMGLDPFSNDTDGDGVSDTLDTDYLQKLDGEIIVVMDTDPASDSFITNLSKTAKVVTATPQDLLENHTSAPNIVLVGRPDAANGSAGAIVRDLLSDSGDELAGMMEGDAERFAVRYGCWNPTQTVIMLSNIWPYDEAQVLGMLKGMRVTRTNSSLRAEFLSSRSEFQLDTYDSYRTTGSQLWGILDGNATFNLTVAKYGKDDVPNALASWNGMGPDEMPLGKYLDVDLGNVVPTAGPVSLSGTHIELFYSISDLDRNGDGDANDTEDFNESLLSLYWFDEANGTWNKLSGSMDWMKGTGVNTTDLTMFGKEYAGYLWADVSHLSLFGVSGKITATTGPVIARAGSDADILIGETVNLNGSLSTGNGAIVNYTWRLHYGNDTVIRYGPLFSFTFTTSGNYSVILSVMDTMSLTAADTVNITVREQPIVPWVLKVGPVKDENGSVVEGVLVTLNVLGTNISNTTGPDGVTSLVLQPGHIEQNVTVYLQKATYQTSELHTRIGGDRKLAAPLPVLVKEKLDPNWTLSFGPILNKKGKPVEGATVSMTSGGRTYTGTTNSTGYVRLVLPKTALGQSVTVSIVKTGYKPTNYNTIISSNGTMSLAPALAPTAVPAPQAFPVLTAVIAGAIIAMLLVSMMVIVLRNKKGKRSRLTGDESESVKDEEE
jgi:hypothetical protein